MNREDRIAEHAATGDFVFHVFDDADYSIEEAQNDFDWLVSVARKARTENSQIQITDRGAMEFDIRSIGELRRLLESFE